MCMRSHSELEVNKINEWGLVYRWQGSDESLQPLVFAAHLGEVEQNTVLQCTDEYS